MLSVAATGRAAAGGSSSWRRRLALQDQVPLEGRCAVVGAADRLNSADGRLLVVRVAADGVSGVELDQGARLAIGGEGVADEADPRQLLVRVRTRGVAPNRHGEPARPDVARAGAIAVSERAVVDAAGELVET